MENNKLINIVKKFSSCKIGVIGDLILDRYLFGRPARISREAPVLILQHEKDLLFAGGAGNTAANLSALGAKVHIFGLIGKDKEAKDIKNILKSMKINIHGLISEKKKTIIKIRIMAGDFNTRRQQILRVDKGEAENLDEKIEEKFIEKIEKISPEMDGWIISDYGYGMGNLSIYNRLRELTKKPVVVDSRYQICNFKKSDLITPNEDEAIKASGIYNDINAAGEKLLSNIQAKAVLITQGNKGMSLFEKKEKVYSIPIVGTSEIVDVSGAGDTVSSTAALVISAGGNFQEATQIANNAASVVVMKKGTATCTQEELINKLKFIY